MLIVVQRVMGEDPDFAKREMFDHIENGGEAKWTMLVQVMQEDDVATIDFDPFDVTKIWPRSQFPMQEVGELTLSELENPYSDLY